jgi:hypothetical protein
MCQTLAIFYPKHSHQAALGIQVYILQNQICKIIFKVHFVILCLDNLVWGFDFIGLRYMPGIDQPKFRVFSVILPMQF